MTSDQNLRAMSIDFALRATGPCGNGSQIVAEAAKIYQYLSSGPKPNKNNAAARKHNKRKSKQ